MFFALSKILDLAVEPVAWAIALAIIAAVLVGRRPRLARAACLVTAAVLLVLASPRTASALLRRLEAGAVSTHDPAAPYDAVIILGGLVRSNSTETRQLELNEAAERLLAAWNVFRAGRARTIFISGTSFGPDDGFDEVGLLRAQLVAWGAPPDRIAVEGLSRNTHQNAVETAKAVRAYGWKRLLVVTSAFHMQRALGCFHREGLRPDALPVDHRAGDGRERLLPRAEALADSALALREFLGRFVYRVVGYSE